MLTKLLSFLFNFAANKPQQATSFLQWRQADTSQSPRRVAVLCILALPTSFPGELFVVYEILIKKWIEYICFRTKTDNYNQGFWSAEFFPFQIEFLPSQFSNWDFGIIEITISGFSSKSDKNVLFTFFKNSSISN